MVRLWLDYWLSGDQLNKKVSYCKAQADRTSAFVNDPVKVFLTSSLVVISHTVRTHLRGPKHLGDAHCSGPAPSGWGCGWWCIFSIDRAGMGACPSNSRSHCYCRSHCCRIHFKSSTKRRSRRRCCSQHHCRS